MTDKIEFLHLVNMKGLLEMYNCVLFLYLLIEIMAQDISHSQSYKDLIKENKRLNSELRKIGPQLNRNHNYSSPKLTEVKDSKVEHFKNVSSLDLQKIKSQELT
jgi:hypothetical protein